MTDACPTSLIVLYFATMMKYKPLILLLGPTAVGKTALSIELCRRFDGEIVNADSRQVYRGLDIGTAKATFTEQAAIPHHLIDVREPDTMITVAEYQRLAFAAIDTIHQRGKVPFLVGGTALYIRAVVEGLQIPEVPPDPKVRGELEEFLAAHGREALFARLQALDPATAAVIDAKNPRRVLRALEIFLISGRPKVELEGANPPPYNILQIGLDRERSVLYQRIDRRVEQMMDEGFLEETRQILQAGYSAQFPALKSFGYRELIMHLDGELKLDEAIAKIKTETHRFARHQYTWFRKMQNIVWFNLQSEETPQQIMTLVDTFLHDSSPTNTCLS